MNARVLVVEDEPMLLKSVVTGLSRIAGVDVVGVGSVGEAVTELEARPPAIVLSDIDLPDRSGIELLGELGARGLKPHVIFVSAYVKAYRAQIPPRAGVEILEKPVSLEQLREIVNQRLSHSTAHTPSPFGVADYLQLATLGRHSVRIGVSGGAEGSLTVVDGEAWGAEDAKGKGPEAFRRLALARGVMVFCETLNGTPGERTLTGSAESLLLECARMTDEEARDAPVPKAGFTELSLEEPTIAPARVELEERSFESWFEEGVELSFKKEYGAALEAFKEAAELNPADSKVQINIARLEKLIAQKEHS